MTQTDETKKPETKMPPQRPIELLAGMAAKMLPNQKILILVEDTGHFEMAGINLQNATDRIGMIEAAHIMTRVEFSRGIAHRAPDVVQSAMKLDG